MKKEKIPTGMKLRHTLRGHENVIFGVVWSPDGRTLASGGRDKAIRLWDTESGELCRTLEGHSNSVLSVAWSPDGRTLASGGAAEKNIHLWDAESGELLRTLEGHTNEVVSVAWSPDGRTLASGSWDNTLRLWDAESGKPTQTIKEHSIWVSNVVWSPDGRTLASGSSNKAIRLWDTDSGKLRRTLEGHTSEVFSVAWSPDGRTLASGSSDNTIRLWNAETGRLLDVLEGHTDEVNCVSFSSDGRSLASKSNDGTVRLWRCDTWETVAILDELSSDTWPPKLAFHPNRPVLTTLGEDDTIIRIWDLDLDVLLDAEKVAPSTHYTNAKVVLVGDSGVGKSGLGLVLSGQKYVPTDSTHGRRVWTLDSREVELDDGRKETREILLWDLAGQPGYRIIHQLHLDEVAVALIVCDARSETDPFAGVLHWNRALRLAQRIQGKSVPPMKTIMVVARTDRGDMVVSPERTMQLIGNMGFYHYIETSAKEGKGIQQLIGVIHQAINWRKLPKVTSTELFQSIKTFLIKEKEEGRLLSTSDDLYRAFLKTRDGEGDTFRAEFDTCVGLVEARGFIRRLSFGGLVLLQPELLDSYAASMVNEARNEPGGLGCIHESRARAGDFYIPDGDRIKEKDQEELLLIATVEDLLGHEIALREETDHGPHMVFPSQFTRENPELPDPEGRAVIFNFEGPVINVYISLVVRLTHSGVFKKEELWKNAALFSAFGIAGYGIWLKPFGDGKAELTLFFREGVSEEMRFQFEEYINSHLQTRALPETIRRRTVFACPICNVTVTDKQAQRRREFGFVDIKCPVCETRINLLDGKERIGGEVPPTLVPEMDRTADERRDREKAVSILQGKIKTNDFDVFLAHNSKNKPQIEIINRELKIRGLYPWIDKEQIPPGRWFQDAIQKTIPNIKSAAIFIGREGLGKWQILELRSFISQCVETNKPVIPVLLPGVKEIPEELIFLNEFTMVRFVEKVDEIEALDNLEWGIRGEKPPRII